ncbi:MAG: transglycosylase domain-containing protein [Candidatus Dormibacteraceae bacterium]
MRRLPVLILLGVLVALVVAWNLAPSVSDAQARVDKQARVEHVPTLMSGEVPPLLAEAVISIEDERFYQHHGLDVVGIARSLLYDVSRHCLCEGGSTIDQQLVKNVYLDGSDRGLNKLTDMILAVKLQTVLKKPTILADYLSIITTGPDRYGVAAAACAYYHTRLSRLTLAEDALVAGLTQDPALYDPLLHPAAAKARRREVLTAMVSEGYITRADANLASSQPIAVTGAGACPSS